MASVAQMQSSPESTQESELDRLAEDFFKLAETQLATMSVEDRGKAIASIHATAEGLRAAK